MAAVKDGVCIAIEYKGDHFDLRMAPGDQSLIPSLLKVNENGSSWPKDTRTYPKTCLSKIMEQAR
ncbi:hypothetical protein BH20VER3_BH20VER3_19480 [soil metagenome]